MSNPLSAFVLECVVPMSDRSNPYAKWDCLNMEEQLIHWMSWCKFMRQDSRLAYFCRYYPDGSMIPPDILEILNALASGEEGDMPMPPLDLRPDAVAMRVHARQDDDVPPAKIRRV